METTIQLDKSTVQTLKMLKKDMKARSYNEVILRLVPKIVPDSMFGSAPWLKPFSERDRLEDRQI
jgi:hypothetical protein